MRMTDHRLRAALAFPVPPAREASRQCPSHLTRGHSIWGGRGEKMYNGHLVVDSDCHIREYWDFDRTYKDNIDPEYRERYARLSKAVYEQKRWPGDLGLGYLLWPRPPGHPMGIYDAFLAEARERPSPNGLTGPLQVTGTGREIDPACHW